MGRGFGGRRASQQRLADLQRLLESAQGLQLLAVGSANDFLRRETAFLEDRVGVVLDVERADVVAEDEVELSLAALQQRRDDAHDPLVNGGREIGGGQEVHLDCSRAARDTLLLHLPQTGTAASGTRPFAAR